MEVQVIANGIIGGLEVAILGLAFQLVYLPTKVFHVALGGVYSVAPFLVWEAMHLGVQTAPAIAIGILGTALISLLAELWNHGLLAKHQGSFSAQFISSLGIYIVIVQFIAITWGNASRGLRTSVDPVTHLGSIAFTESDWRVIGGSLSILTGFFVWLRFTKVGLVFRGLADNPKELALRGYNIRRLRCIAFAISGAMAAGISILTAWGNGFWSYGGLSVLLLAVVSAIIGGRYSFVGAVIGGLILELGRAEVEWYMSARWIDAATFLLLAFFLLFRPNGIVTRRARLEAEAR